MIKNLTCILFMIVVLFSQVAYAMNMSSMNNVGSAWRFPDSSIVIENAISNQGKKVIKNGKEWKANGGKTTVWESGVASFGDAGHPLYLTYDTGVAGGKTYFSDLNKTKVIIQYVAVGTDIYTVKNDSNLILYFLEATEQFMFGPHRYILCGYRQDGKFVVYFDTNDIIKNYGISNGDNKYLSFAKPVFYGNAIKIVYNVHHNKKDLTNDGELIFKWDEGAQWFSVNHVVY